MNTSRIGTVALGIGCLAAVAVGDFTVMDEETAVEAGPGWGGNSNEGYNKDIRYASDGSATATWTFTGLADGLYDVAASWSLHANRSTDISYTIGSNPAVHVNQEKFGVGPYLAGTPASDTYLFDYLGGPVHVTGGTLTVAAGNNLSGTSNYLIADAVAVRPAAPRTLIMDNKSEGFATTFQTFKGDEGFLRGIWYPQPNANAANRSATWDFTDLPDGLYKIYATWSTHGNRTQAAPFSVYDTAGQVGPTVTVNQEASPYQSARSDLQNVDTAHWRNLGSFRAGDGTLTVQLNGVDNAGGTDYVIADAIRIERIAPSRTQPFLGAFRANPAGGADPWYFTDTITRPTHADAVNPGWGDGALRDRPVAGDWNGDGTDGIAVFRSGGDNRWYFSQDRSQPVTAFSSGPWGSGAIGDLPVAGDWDGDGIDGVGVFRTSVGGSGTNWFLAENPAALATNYQFHYGSGVAAIGDLPVAGDWDGDGLDTVGVFRTTTNTWYLSNSLAGQTAYSFLSAFAQPGDVPVAEDWDGDGKDDVGLWRPSTGEWFFDTNFDGLADFHNPGFGEGSLYDIPLAGHRYVPEPATIALALIALAGLGGYTRRRRHV